MVTSSRHPRNRNISATLDRRSADLDDLILDLGLLVANEGSVPTYRQRDLESVIDATFYDPGSTIAGWRVLDRYSDSDYSYVYIALSLTGEDSTPAELGGVGWVPRGLNAKKLTRHVVAFRLPDDPEEVAEAFFRDLATQRCQEKEAAPQEGKIVLSHK